MSRLISMLERGDPAAADVMRDIDAHTGGAYTLGITGPPGAGKSTIVDQLTRLLREQGQRVGIVAVDPTSPFSGGALLGDRIRMQRHYLDSGVFIRSVATRGQAGGLPRIVKGIARALDAAGFDVVIVETVGVGQTELGIMGVADTVAVALIPEAGDSIQALEGRRDGDCRPVRGEQGRPRRGRPDGGISHGHAPDVADHTGVGAARDADRRPHGPGHRRTLG